MSELKAKQVFEEMSKRLDEEKVKKVGKKFRFNIKPDDGGSEQSWLVDLTSGSGKIDKVTGDEKGDCTITIKDTDFVNLVLGKLNPQKAFMTGKLKLKGNMMLAQKLPVIFGDAKKAKL